MDSSEANSKKDPTKLIAEWGRTGRDEVEPPLREALQELVRRHVGDLLLIDGLWAPIDLERLAVDITRKFGADVGLAKQSLLEKSIKEIASEVLVDEEPQEVTRWLWMWDKDDKGTARDVEQQLFRAIEVELRKRMFRILHRSNFVGMNYKIDQGDLVSELYLKLKKGGIPRLPENRKQFYGFVDVAITRILLDMQKAAGRHHRPQSRKGEPILDMHVDPRTGQNQLQALLDAEDAELHIAKRLRLEENRKQLRPRQQEIFRLRSNGVSVAETAEIIGCSEATVKRDFGAAITFLTMKQLAVSDDHDA